MTTTPKDVFARANTAELVRKCVHLAGCLVAASLGALLPLQTISILAFAWVPLLVWCRHFGIFPLLRSVGRASAGDVWYPIGIALAALLSPTVTIYVFAVTVLGLSDSFASLAGQRFGRLFYRVGEGTKSLEGSFVFLITTLSIGLVMAQFTEFSSITAIMIVALILTCTEALFSRGIDNLAIPVFAVLLATHL